MARVPLKKRPSLTWKLASLCASISSTRTRLRPIRIRMTRGGMLSRR